MPVSASQKRAVTKYVKNNYDKFSLYMEKGKKAQLQEHCQKFNYNSVNDFINTAIATQLKIDQENSKKTHDPL